jgi:hypothetical protein
MSDTIYLRRSDAAKLIEKIRELACPGRDGQQARIAVVSKPEVALRELLMEAGIPALAPCEGEAHSNAHIDNCLSCAPRWGYVGPEVKIR